MNAKELFERNLGTIRRIALSVCRRHGVRDASEADDFVSEVNCRLLEDDLDIIRKFKGVSSFATYLWSVITFLYYEHLVNEKGKWRSSAEAKRLGPRAVEFERLITREGLSVREAIQTMCMRADDCTPGELEAIYVRLPRRMPKPVRVSEDASVHVPASESADELLLADERERLCRRIAEVIDNTIAQFDDEDQLILRMRFWDGLKAREIGDIIGVTEKRVFKRIEKLCTVLRKTLIGAGLSDADIRDLLGRADQELRVNLLSSGNFERPSLS